MVEATLIGRIVGRLGRERRDSRDDRDKRKQRTGEQVGPHLLPRCLDCGDEGAHAPAQMARMLASITDFRRRSYYRWKPGEKSLHLLTDPDRFDVALLSTMLNARRSSWKHRTR